MEPVSVAPPPNDGIAPPPLPPSAGGVIGIIYPPPEVRNIVDKTASFTARNGYEFELRIRQNEANNPNFNFLNPNNPYNAYYKHKVKEFREGKSASEPAPASTVSSGAAGDQSSSSAMTSAVSRPGEVNFLNSTALSAKRLLTDDIVIPKEAPPDFEFCTDPPSISALDLDVVRLTAQFVARNGREFLTKLMHKEARNFMFDFLRPQHNLFQYFTKLIEQYTKILLPPKDLRVKLQRERDNPTQVLKAVKYRAAWTKVKQKEQQRAEEEKERERVSYYQIDWHDFVVVETVDFQQGDIGNFPPPTTTDAVGARLLREERITKFPSMPKSMLGATPAAAAIPVDALIADQNLDEGGAEDVEEVADNVSEASDVEMAIDDDDVAETVPQPTEPPAAAQVDSAPAVSAPPPPPPPSASTFLPPAEVPPSAAGKIVRENYNPKAPKAPARQELQLVSPLTGDLVQPGKVSQHVKHSLLDPKWIEEKRRQIAEKQAEEQVYAGGGDINSALQNLAQHRTDMFGQEETQIGQKLHDIGPSKDGQADDNPDIAPKKVTVEEQLATLRQVGSLQDDVPPPPPPPPKSVVGGPVAQPPPRMAQPPMMRTSGAMHHHHQYQGGPPALLQQQAGHAMIGGPGGSGGPPPPRMAPPPAAPPVPSQPPLGIVAQAPQLGLPLNLQPIGQAPPVLLTHVRAPPPVQKPGPPPPPAPAPPMRAPPLGSAPQIQLGMPAPDQDMDSGLGGPSAPKKSRTEADLVDEKVWLGRVPNPCPYKVATPARPDLNLSGQTFAMLTPPTDQIAAIKNKIAELTGLAVSKQKFSIDGLFLKDNQSLAFYNVTPQTVIHLSIKERGGRKK